MDTNLDSTHRLKKYIIDGLKSDKVKLVNGRGGSSQKILEGCISVEARMAVTITGS